MHISHQYIYMPSSILLYRLISLDNLGLPLIYDCVVVWCLFTPRWLALCRGRVLVCLDDLARYAGDLCVSMILQAMPTETFLVTFQSRTCCKLETKNLQLFLFFAFFFFFFFYAILFLLFPYFLLGKLRVFVGMIRIRIIGIIEYSFWNTFLYLAYKTLNHT